MERTSRWGAFKPQQRSRARLWLAEDGALLTMGLKKGGYRPSADRRASGVPDAPQLLSNRPAIEVRA